MRTRRLLPALILVLAASTTLPQRAQASPRSESWASRSPVLGAKVELMLLRAIEKVEVFLGLATPATTPGEKGSNPPALQLDCRSGIDPNGGGCTS